MSDDTWGPEHDKPISYGLSGGFGPEHDKPISYKLTNKGRNIHFSAGQKDAKIIPFKRKGE
jgi:hypothetical protein